MKYGKRDVYPVKRKRNWIIIPVVVLVLLIGGSWMMETLLDYARTLFGLMTG